MWAWLRSVFAGSSRSESVWTDETHLLRYLAGIDGPRRGPR
jgi:hypothetical protein